MSTYILTWKRRAKSPNKDHAQRKLDELFGRFTHRRIGDELEEFQSDDIFATFWSKVKSGIGKHFAFCLCEANGKSVRAVASPKDLERRLKSVQRDNMDQFLDELESILKKFPA